MNIQKWLSRNTGPLKGKTAAVTGGTGCLGAAVCREILALSGRLILIARNPKKAEGLLSGLKKDFPKADVRCLYTDLSDMQSVGKLCAELKKEVIDVLFLSAGAYHIPRKTCASGLDNVFTINFMSHYRIVKELLPQL